MRKQILKIVSNGAPCPKPRPPLPQCILQISSCGIQTLQTQSSTGTPPLCMKAPVIGQGLSEACEQSPDEGQKNYYLKKKLSNEATVIK